MASKVRSGHVFTHVNPYTFLLHMIFPPTFPTLTSCDSQPVLRISLKKAGFSVESCDFPLNLPLPPVNLALGIALVRCDLKGWGWDRWKAHKTRNNYDPTFWDNSTTCWRSLGHKKAHQNWRIPGDTTFGFYRRHYFWRLLYFHFFEKKCEMTYKRVGQLLKSPKKDPPGHTSWNRWCPRRHTICIRRFIYPGIQGMYLGQMKTILWEGLLRIVLVHLVFQNALCTPCLLLFFFM